MKKSILRGVPARQTMLRLFVCVITLFFSSQFIAQNVSVSGALVGNGSYPDLNSAFAAINGGAQTAANISVSILASTTETASAVLNAGAWTSLSIAPSGGALRIVGGGIAAPLVDLDGADNVYVDGLNTGGNGLTFSNTDLAGHTIRFMNGATNNTLTNCSALGSGTLVSLGVISFSTSSSAGNSNNTISSCTISAAGTNYPANCVLSAGTSTAVNSNNAIQNCQVSDFFSATLASSGIFVGANNSDWTITGNRLFQTLGRTYTSANTHKAIQIGSGSGYIVSNNIVGYASASGTGNYSMAGAVASRFVGIELSVASGTLPASSVQGNTITAITFTSTGTTATSNGVLCGINIAAGNAEVGNTNGNIIGGTTGANHITLQPGNTGLLVGINSASTGTVLIQNNVIGGLIAEGSSAAASGGVMGVNISGAATSLIISGNIVGNTTPDNMRAGALGTSTVNSTCVGINFASAPTTTVIVSGNTIRNMASYGIGTGGAMRGIYTTGTSGTSTTYSVVNNNISGLITDNRNVGVGNGQIGTGGILITYGTNNRISNNQINGISNISTFTTGICLVGISTAVAGNPVISSNRIYGLTLAGTSTVVTAPARVFGIFVRGGLNDCTIQNNMISLGDGQTTNTSFVGIDVFGGGGAPTLTRIYFNTININGVVTAGDQPSFGIYRGDFSTSALTFPVDIRNNIVTNTRSGGTGSHFALANNYGAAASSVSGWGVNAANYNVLNANASTIGWWTGAQTFAGWKTASNSDANSYSGITVTYVNAANDLHLNMGVTPTFIESGAQPITGITTDIDNQVRPGPAASVNGGALAPDIGADEIDAFLLDLTPPVMTGSGFTTPGCITSGRTFTASFTDLVGLASGSLAPRIYYRINAGAYTSVSGTLTSGTASNGVWTFNMTYSAVLSDVVSYFVVAQDAFNTPNLTSFPSAGFAGTDVNTVSSNPTSPNTYGINALNGVYTVGASGTFTSLTAASVAYNTFCLTGPVTFSLTDALYSTAETFPIVFTNNTDASATNSLLIIPASGLAVAVTPTNTAVTSVIKFLNARYITVDGLNTGGSSLAVNNANVTSASANIWLASSGLGNNHIAIKNTALVGGYNTGSNGVIASVDGASPSATGGSDNDNITITGNSFTTFFQGILAIGSASVSSGGMDNWIISNNQIGPVTSGASNIGGNGIVISSALNLSVAGNTIQNISTSSSGVSAININSNITGFMVSGNTIRNITSSTTSGGVNAISGVYMGAAVINGTVSANKLTTIYNTNSSGYGARAINVNTGSLSAVYINNNFISDVYSYSDAGTNWWPIGIALEGTSGAVNIDNNTVNLFGSFAGYNSASRSAALFINSSGGALNIRNNVFVNTFDNTTVTTDINYGIYSGVAASNFSVINNNNYYVSGASSVPVLGYLGSNQTSIANIQTAFGGNLNSVNAQPSFVSNTDLHMQLVAANLPFENTGVPVAGITLDIDNQTRNVSTPDMGADEFTLPTCTVASGGVLTASTASACAGQTLTANSTGFSTGLTSTYVWKVGATPGGPYAPVSGGTGSNTPSYTSAPLPAGIYYVILETTCGATSSTATSNEGTLTVNALPTATAAVTTSASCAGQAVNLSGSGSASNYSWSGPGGFTSSSQNPVIASANATASGVYSLVTSGSGCNSLPATVAIAVYPFPQTPVITPSTALICAGSSETLAATGGASAPLLDFGTEANQNTASTTSAGYPAPYSAYYGGQKMQMLILASEMYAAGFVSGSAITNVQFPVVSRGSNWGSSITENQNFQVNIGFTSLNSLTTFQSGLTNVVAPSSFTPVVGYSNTHTFSSPVIWDGSSNVILETTFSNNFSGTANDLVVQYNSPTSFQSTVVYRVDSQTAPVVAAATATNFVYSARPDFKLNGTSIGTMVWSPALGLSSTTGQSVTASPVSSTIYTLTASFGSCSSTETVAVNVTPVPVLTIATTATAVCIGNQATLTASGATTFTWDSNNSSATEVVSPLATTVYTVSNLTAPCALVTETISIVVNPLPVVTAVAGSSAGICAGETETLTAGGAVNYSWTAGPLTNTYAVNPSATTVYTVSGEDAEGCIALATVEVTVNAGPGMTVTPASSTVCALSPVNFLAAGAISYSWSSGSTSAAETVTPGVSGTYSVTGFSAEGCATVETMTVTVNALPVLSISPATPTICIGESLVLTGNGALTYSWMPAGSAASTATLAVNPTASTSYTLEGEDANNCKNSVSVLVTVGECTGLTEQGFAKANISLYPNPSTGAVTADFGFEGQKEIMVLNSLGALVMKVSTGETQTSFDLSAYAKGVYFVHIKSQGTSANYRIVIQ